jgi:hypothetical protein
MTDRERKALAIALAIGGVAALVFTVLYAAGLVESPVPALVMAAMAAVVVPAAVLHARRSR